MCPKQQIDVRFLLQNEMMFLKTLLMLPWKYGVCGQEICLQFIFCLEEVTKQNRCFYFCCLSGIIPEKFGKQNGTLRDFREMLQKFIFSDT